MKNERIPMSAMTTKELLKVVVPFPARLWLSEQKQSVKHSLRKLGRGLDSVSLRRTTPVSTDWGVSRGQIIDRYYVEQFLAERAADIRGHVLEFDQDLYAHRFGGKNITRIDILHSAEGNPRATIVADLAEGENLPSDTFDCIICTQVLHFVYDVRAGVRTLYRILKPGGVVLVTAPGIQKIERPPMKKWEEHWRFTTLSLSRLFGEVFPEENIEVKASGNVLAAIAFLHGFAVEDLRLQDLEYRDPDYEVSIALRAVRPRPVRSD
ncbi:MAG: methyltransferase domain-containing protein [Candidatus Sulfotelmatobacter sp.]